MSPLSLLSATILACAAAESRYSQHVSLATLGSQAVSTPTAKEAHREPTMADLLYGAEAGHSSLVLAEQYGPVKVPEQGYTGKKVFHTNMQSATEDFGNEYGPDMKKQAEPAKFFARSGSPAASCMLAMAALFAMLFF